MVKRVLSFISLFLVLVACNAKDGCVVDQLQVGASRTVDYLPFLDGKRVALVVNQTSVIGNTHLLDSLLSLRVNITKVFAPEHGFRGVEDAGESVASSIDKKSGIHIISLYGKKLKPTSEDLSDVDVILFDIQDVGVRFYTYISTMKYLMEACALNHKQLIVLDRPNPNGDYIDGPVLEKGFTSFVGVVPIPIVYGMSIGELATMMNGEGWLEEGVKCNLRVIEMRHYNRSAHYSLSIKPSPNLPNDRSIRLYPSLCFFEGTSISVGRGTAFPFQVIGYPDTVFGKFSFTPKSIVGMSKNPLQENKLCYGIDLHESLDNDTFTLKYLLDFYRKFPNKQLFFSNERFFNLLAGNDLLIKQIRNNSSESEIRMSWQSDLIKYKTIRVKYLLYP